MQIEILKRDGKKEKFEAFKIEDAIKKAFKSVNTIYDKSAKIGLNRTTMQELDRTQKRSLTGQ